MNNKLLSLIFSNQVLNAKSTTTLNKKTRRCPECNKKIPIAYFKEETIKESRKGLIFNRIGLCDKDTIATIEYMVTYSICPLCNHREEISRYTIRTLKNT